MSFFVPICPYLSLFVPAPKTRVIIFRIMATKIERAGLKPVALNFLRSGYTEVEIAEALNKQCADQRLTNKYGEIWVFSQSTVNRELKSYRDKYKDQAKDKLDKFVNDHIESDLKVIEEAERYHVGVARDEDEEHRVRSESYMRAAKLIFEKLKTALGGADDKDISELIADELKKSIDPDLQEKLDGIISQGTDITAVSGPH